MKVDEAYRKLHGIDDHRWTLVNAINGRGIYACACGAESEQSYGRDAELRRKQPFVVKQSAIDARKGVRKKVLEQIRNFNAEKSDIDEMVEMYVGGEAILKNGYEALNLEAPEWLKDGIAALRKEIASRRRDNLERALKLAVGRLEAQKSAEEKRTDTRAEIERLKAALEAQK